MDGRALLDRVRAVVKSPGVPCDAPAIAAARERGVPVLGELELAWRLLENEFVAVTGTNGKTTTVELVGHIHRRAGLPVAVAGNVGTPLSSLIGSLDADATVVCEASSFQLEDTLAFAPEAAVLLNLAPDHLDRHGTFDGLRRRQARDLRPPGRDGRRGVARGPRAPARRTVETSADGEAGVAPPRVPEQRVASSSAGTPRRRCSSSTASCGGERSRWWRCRRCACAGATTSRTRWPPPRCASRAGWTPTPCAKAWSRSRASPTAWRRSPTVDGVLYVNDSKATNVASTLVALRGVRRAPGAPDPRRAGQGPGLLRLREPVRSAARPSI